MNSLRGSKILIGKEQHGNHLQIAVYKNNKRAYVNVPNCAPVPPTVSRLVLGEGQAKAHCMINVDMNGNMTIANLKPQNTTYVEGMQCEQKTINPHSNVSLGMNYYPLDMQSVLSSASQLAIKIGGVVSGGERRQNAGIQQGAMGGQGQYGGGNQGMKKEAPMVSIAHLAGIYERYESDIAEVRHKTRKINILASSSSVFTLGSMTISSLAPHLGLDGSIQKSLYIFTAIAFIIAISSVILRIKDNSEQMIKEINDRFMHEYNCPHCGKFLGNQKFFLLQQAGGHNCGCKFRW